MSVYDNILGIAQISIKDTEQQKAITEKLLDEFNLQHLRRLNASVLSGGEIRRLMMARIMINKPKVILLDEPMAALDPIVVQDIQKYILKMTIQDIIRALSQPFYSGIEFFQLKT